MKKVLTMLAAGAIVATASADLTGFYWTGGDSASVPAGGNVLTFVDGASFYALLSPGTTTDYVIQLADLSGLTADDVSAKEVLLPFQGGTWGINPADTIVGTGAWVGMTPMAIVDDASAAADLAVLGTVFEITAVGSALVDLQPNTDLPANAAEEITPVLSGTVEVVPEPATIGLMGVAGLGMFLARRKARR